MAENFIHRVGRTGRAGGHGVATTLFSREQRSELFQLERTLGIRIERLNADSSPTKPNNGVHIRTQSSHNAVQRRCKGSCGSLDDDRFAWRDTAGADRKLKRIQLLG